MGYLSCIVYSVLETEHSIHILKKVDLKFIHVLYSNITRLWQSIQNALKDSHLEAKDLHQTSQLFK